MDATNWGGCITDAHPGQISPGELQLPSWTLTTGLNISAPAAHPAFLLSSPPPPPPPTVQTGQYRAAAGLSGFSRARSSTSGSGASSSSSSRAEAEVEEQQPASSKWPASSTSSLLQTVDTTDSCLGIEEETSREAEDRPHTKDICWGQLTHREDTYWSQKSREESLLATRESFEISGRKKEVEEETYWTYRREPEVGVEVESRRELGREGALGGRMSSR